jgi:hypothetical protein
LHTKVGRYENAILLASLLGLEITKLKLRADMRRIITTVIALSLLAGCSSTKPSNQSANPVPAVQQTVAQMSAPVSDEASFPTFNLADIPKPSVQWILVGNDATNGDQIDIDAKTFVRQGNLVHFWQRRVTSVPKLNNISISLNYQSLDCGRGVYRFHKDLYLDRSGNVINQTEGDSQLQNVVPGSVGQMVSQFVCQSRASSATDPNSMIVKAQLEALERGREANAEMTRKSMESAAKLFR